MKPGSVQRPKKQRNSRVRDSLERYNKAISIQRTDEDTCKESNDRQKILNQFTGNQFQHKIIGAPSLMRVMVKQDPKVPQTARVEVDDNEETKTTKSSVYTNQRFNDKGSTVNLDQLNNLHDELMSLISKVDEIDSINTFKQKYIHDYTKQKLLEKSYEFESFKGKWTFLHEASKYGNTDIARFLILDIKQDPNVVSESFWTPLQLACKYEKLNMIKLLLEDTRTDPELVTDYTRGPAAEILIRNMDIKKLNDIQEDPNLEVIRQKLLPSQTSKVIVPYLKRSSSLAESNGISKEQSENYRPKDFFGSVGRKPTYSEKKVMNKELQLIKFSVDKVKENIHNKKLRIYQGYIGRSKSLGLKIEYRWIMLNPISGNLIEFKSREECPNKPYRIIPLHTIQSLEISNQTWLMKKNLFYWEINNKFIMWNKSSGCRSDWMKRINSAKAYADWINTLKNIRYTDLPHTEKLLISELDKRYIEKLLDLFLKQNWKTVEILDILNESGKRSSNSSKSSKSHSSKSHSLSKDKTSPSRFTCLAIV